MRSGAASAINHLYSKIASLESSLGSVPLDLNFDGREHLGRDFSRLLAPVIGPAAADDLFCRTLERIRGQKPESLKTLGALAAFFLGEDEDPLVPLRDEDWREIQDTLEDVSGEMNLDTLTVLMGKLLSRGILTEK
jgi:ubiquinone biosynthesis protein UbiJ